MEAGTARIGITPDRPIIMAGYAARKGHSEGLYRALYAKALVLRHESEPVALITTDLIGFDRKTCDAVKEAIRERTGLPPERVILTASHTHTGPEIRLGMTEEKEDLDEGYARWLIGRIAEVTAYAAERLEPVSLTFATSPCTLGVNRRLPTEEGVMMRPNPRGITDPVLTALTFRRPDTTPIAVVMSYACHPTTLGGYLIGADYPGFGQDLVEAEYPGCTAFFVQGCGADIKVRHIDGQGRFKSGPCAVARSLGEELARAALVALCAEQRPVEGALHCGLTQVEMPLQPPPSRAEAEAMTQNENEHFARWGREMLRIHDEGGTFMTSRSMDLQTLTAGGFALVALGGEICVGYSLRLKRELASSFKDVLVAGYANGMIGYVPTAAMMSEGGYEVSESYRYHLVPAPYAPEVEDAICAQVAEQLERLAAE